MAKSLKSRVGFNPKGIKKCYFAELNWGEKDGIVRL